MTDAPEFHEVAGPVDHKLANGHRYYTAEECDAFDRGGIYALYALLDSILRLVGPNEDIPAMLLAEVIIAGTDSIETIPSRDRVPTGDQEVDARRLLDLKAKVDAMNSDVNGSRDRMRVKLAEHIGIPVEVLALLAGNRK